MFRVLYCITYQVNLRSELSAWCSIVKNVMHTCVDMVPPSQEIFIRFVLMFGDCKKCIQIDMLLGGHCILL